MERKELAEMANWLRLPHKLAMGQIECVHQLDSRVISYTSEKMLEDGI